MRLQIGEVSNIVVSSPEIAQEMMRTHDVNFSNRPHLLIANKYYGIDIVFAPHGEYWRMLRKICNQELLSPKRILSFRTIREEETSKLVADIYSISDNGLRPVNLSKNVFSMIYVITAKAAFGKICKEQEEFISNVDEGLKIAAGFSLSEAFPSQKWLLWFTGIGPRFEKNAQTLERILDDIIGEHKLEKDDNNYCLLDVLLNLHNDRDLPFPLEKINIRAIILDIFVAGSETSSTVIEWAMLELLRNPRVMKKAQSEVRQVFRSLGNVVESEIYKLKYLNMVIKETLRLHPPGPLLIPRQSQESCEINGYYIPAKTRVIVNAFAIGRDPSHWDEPEEFYPERFVDSSVDFKGSNFELIPFGAGRRICPGVSFANADIEIALAQLLFHFDWNLPNGEKFENLDMTEVFGMTVRRKGDVYVIPVPYEQSIFYHPK